MRFWGAHEVVNHPLLPCGARAFHTALPLRAQFDCSRSPQPIQSLVQVPSPRMEALQPWAAQPWAAAAPLLPPSAPLPVTHNVELSSEDEQQALLPRGAGEGAGGAAGPGRGLWGSGRPGLIAARSGRWAVGRARRASRPNHDARTGAPPLRAPGPLPGLNSVVGRRSRRERGAAGTPSRPLAPVARTRPAGAPGPPPAPPAPRRLGPDRGIPDALYCLPHRRRRPPCTPLVMQWCSSAATPARGNRSSASAPSCGGRWAWADGTGW